MPRDLNRITARLASLGLADLSQKLIYGQQTETRELNFSTLSGAKTAMALLYDLLWFYPEAKERISLRLMQATCTLYIIPKSRRETRGKRGPKQ